MGRRLLSAAAADRLLRSHVAAVGGGAASSDLPDLCEEDVWAASHGTGGGRSRWRRGDGGDRKLHVGGLSKALEGGGCQSAMSAPVSVSFPEWGRTGMGRIGPAETGGLKGEEEEEQEWVPPHEYLAREHGKTALATSVFEGVGRTLKGRDLSRVRNAVWSQTGFFG